ncbi:MAG: cytochrome c [Dehalococcoidia bacterium]|nr:cytochrome c [Dehalococcoidia bacterium]
MKDQLVSNFGNGVPTERKGRGASAASRGPRGRTIVLAALLLVVVALAAAGCASGTYPVDIFYEMHYQQSYGPHEPPVLSAPAGSVPITGVQLSTGENPFTPGESVLAAGEYIYSTNCVFCHGAQGLGDGPVLNTMKESFGYGTDSQPYTITPNLTDSYVVDQTDAGLYGWITNGVTVMPSFAKLLSVDDRWRVVTYIRACLIDDHDSCP